MTGKYDDMTAIEILNYYRNYHYADGSNTESGILANAINEILPELIGLRATMEIVRTRIPSLLEDAEFNSFSDSKRCLYCISSKIADGSDRILACYNCHGRVGKRTLLSPEDSCPNFCEDPNL
jgi:hypothetical protein